MQSHQLDAFINQVANAGIRGQSMQAKLAELVQKHDFSAHQIRRIAEGANKRASVEITKSAHNTGRDPRVKFELCDPEPLVAQARKHAEASLVTAPSPDEVLQAAFNAAGGDPFAPPEAEFELPKKIAESPVDIGLLAGTVDAEYRGMLRQLLDTEETLKKAELEVEARMADANDKMERSFEAAVDAVADLVEAHVTIPDIYLAVYASMGSNPDAYALTDVIMRKVLERLKERGVPTSRFGFRYPYSDAEIAGFGPDTVLALCRRVCGVEQEGLPRARGDVKLSSRQLPALDPEAIKQANRYMEESLRLFPADKDKNLSNPEEASKWLNERDSFKTPGAYLDDRDIDNKPRIINAESELIMAVTDMLGSRGRMLQLHGANEYLGLKLKEIAEALKGVSEGRETAATRYEAAMQKMPETAAGGKVANPLLGLAAMAGRAALGGLASAAGSKAVGAAMAPKEAKKAEGPLLFGDALKISNFASGLKGMWHGADASSKLTAIGSLGGAVAQPVLSHVLPARSEDVTKRPQTPAGV